MIAANLEVAGALQSNLQASAHELVRRNTPRGGDTQEDIADAIALPRGRLSQLLNKSGENLPVHVAVQLHRALKDDFLTQAICHACGGFFLPYAKAPMSPADSRCAFTSAMALLGDGMRESGEALAVATEVIRDRVATREEKSRAKDEILETISALGKLLQEIQAMPEHAAAPLRGFGGGDRF